ncbi:SDR family oxidoreductase [Candidatus Woesearchaeota archaeon]|nr:SDR family oxidoreductase [Candidatus Woesearchaeota archaeon]
MKRLERIIKSERLKGKRIVITGCGYKPLRHTFYDITTGEPSQDSINVIGQEMKLNIGSAVAGVLALNGATVHMVSTSKDKLVIIKKSLASIVDQSLIEYSALDLLDEEQVKSFVKNLPKDKPIYWVQSVGLGAGSYRLKDDNPYLPIEEIPLELIERESQIVLRATHLMMRELLPVFRKQEETRIALITSMSAIRGYSYGATHCAAKGAIDRYANAVMLGLYRDNIFVTSVRPGGIDTGMYDNVVVQEAVKEITNEFNCDYSKGLRLAPPTTVGEAVSYVFTTPAHIPSLNLVAKGQMPHEGS